MNPGTNNTSSFYNQFYTNNMAPNRIQYNSIGNLHKPNDGASRSSNWPYPSSSENLPTKNSVVNKN